MGGGTLRSRCSEPATAATAVKRTAAATAGKLAVAATVKQSPAAVRQGGLRGSERVGVRRVRIMTDGSALRAVGARGGGV